MTLLRSSFILKTREILNSQLAVDFGKASTYGITMRFDGSTERLDHAAYRLANRLANRAAYRTANRLANRSANRAIRWFDCAA